MLVYTATCDFYWGTHGCDLARGHDGTLHRCGPSEEGDPVHCEFDEATGLGRAYYWDEGAPDDGYWGEWSDMYGEGWRNDEIPPQPEG